MPPDIYFSIRNLTTIDYFKHDYIKSTTNTRSMSNGIKFYDLFAYLKGLPDFR